MEPALSPCSLGESLLLNKANGSDEWVNRERYGIQFKKRAVAWVGM